MIGKLVYWNHGRGFGFVTRDDKKENNIFIHAVAFPENTIPQPGNTIEYEILNGPDGRPRGANASIVE